MHAEKRPHNTGPTSAGLASVDLNLLVMLEALLEEQSVTRAAERIGLSQPAMSHALARIRRVFDDEILVRTGGRSVLTPRAQQLRIPLREVLYRTEDLFEAGGFDPRTDTREAVVAMTPSTALVIGNPLARLLAAEAPGIRLHLLSTQLLSDTLFTQDGVDVMLLSEAFDTAHPRERLYEDEWRVISGTPDLTARTALELLATRPHVVHEPMLDRAPYRALREAGVRWSVQTRLHDPLLAPGMVAGTERISIHRRRVLAAMTTPELRDVALPVEAGRLGMDLVWNPWIDKGPFRAWLGDLLLRAAPA